MLDVHSGYHSMLLLTVYIQTALFFPIVEKNVPCEGLCKFDLQNCGLFPRKWRELKASFHSLFSQTPRVDLEGLLVENSACQRWEKEIIIQKNCLSRL